MFRDFIPDPNLTLLSYLPTPVFCGSGDHNADHPIHTAGVPVGLHLLGCEGVAQVLYLGMWVVCTEMCLLAGWI